MLVLFETQAGYALFKLLDKGKLKEVNDLHKEFVTPDSAAGVVKLKAFHKFEDTAQALAAATAICDQKLDPALASFLKDSVKESAKLAVGDLQLGNLIKSELGIKCVYDDGVLELLRGIRSQIESLLPGIAPHDRRAMTLGLSHSFCRYKLKFSPDKVDVMIIQAIALLDELDKELNTYAMRVKEWYGWHFPEMTKILVDNIQYAKTVKKMGVRTNAHSSDLSDILTEELEQELKQAAEVSMGTEIADEDIENIQSLCDQVITLSDYRASLFDYLKNRMQAIAPNMSVMVGELVGARLIAHAGSLLHLAKHPASTVQILGAEKALFRALKTKHDTPKYGLIYHASLVGQAPPKLKGKISRVLAAKTALAIRTDALGNADGVTIGYETREKVENRLRVLEGGKVTQLSGTAKGKAAQQKYEKPSKVESYNADADVAIASANGDADDSEEKQKKKKKKKERDSVAPDADESVSATPKQSKRKADDDADNEDGASAKKKKKRKLEESESAEPAAETAEDDETAPKKKKKKKHHAEDADA